MRRPQYAYRVQNSFSAKAEYSAWSTHRCSGPSTPTEQKHTCMGGCYIAGGPTSCGEPAALASPMGSYAKPGAPAG